jgi:hypothetical protein
MVFPSGFSTRILKVYIVSPMHVTFPSQFIFRNLIVLIMGGTYYDAPHYAIFLHLPSTSSWQVPIYFLQYPLLRHF